MNHKITRIEQLKKEKNAVILAHYYAPPAVQEAADYIGDSFYLSKLAVQLSEPVIVFCGVSFMGESAKLLNPDKTVLMPDPTADCPMAHMVQKAVIDQARAEYDDLAVVCYVNSTAEIKSWSDVCVTSANAVKIVRSLPQQHILFIPDRNLGHFVAEQVPEKQFLYNEGYCPRHEFMSADEIRAQKEACPQAQILVHPECSAAVTAMADYIGSTSGIIQYAAAHTECQDFIIGTVSGVIYKLQEVRPDAHFYFPATRPSCPDMERITLDQIIHVLETGDHAVSLPPKDTARQAMRTLNRMLELA